MTGCRVGAFLLVLLASLPSSLPAQPEQTVPAEPASSAPAASTPPAVVRDASDPFVDEAAPPPFSWTCPMHPEIHATHDGPCPICNMNLVETRRVEAWTCPLHSVILETEGGTCPIGGRTLVPLRLELSWTCPDHPDVTSLEPSICPIDGGRQLVQKLSALPHEDHTPKHGGIFFMAPDNWHHLEGTYPEPGRFIVHLYDNYSQPMTAGATKGRVVLNERYDVNTGEIHELLAYPLLAAPDGTYLEAGVGTQDFPTEITAKVRFEPGGPEERFDFIFADYSSDPGTAPPAPTTAAVEPPSPTPAPVTSPPPAAVTLIAPTIPDAPADIASEIASRDVRIDELMAEGAFTEIYIPALEAKDLALALTPHLDGLPAPHQLTVRLAVKTLVRGAWMLDWYGDLGNRQRVQEAYALFGSAVVDIKAAYAIP